MARRRTITPAERKRRASQSAKDKSANRPTNKASGRKRSTGSGGSSRRSTRRLSSVKQVHPYTKLILDPCKAKLTKTPLAGREGSSLFRLPFRYVITMPSASANIKGQAGTYTPCTSLTVALAPSAMRTTLSPSGGIASISIACAVNESSAPRTDAEITAGTVGNDLYSNLDPQGLAGLNAITSLCRPVAGCVKLEYYSGGTNTGSFFGYEGVAGDLFRLYGTSAFVPNTSNSNIAMQGITNGIVTEGVEVATNYASADPEWQEFKQLKNDTITGSPDAANSDISGMPVAIAGVGGATPGTQYLVSGAVVYEWVPSLALGPNAAGADRPVVRNDSILTTVQKQLSAYGPMLVGVASKLVTGGPTSALADVMYRLAINRNNTNDSIVQSSW